MDEMNRKRVEVLRTQYPPGCLVELISMDDEFAPPKGTKGTVLHVDDIGNIHIAWRNGSTLGIIPGVDMVRRLDEDIPGKIS